MNTLEGGSGPTGHYSKWTPASLAVLGLGLVGAALLIMADLSTLVEIKVLTVTEQEDRKSVV